MKYKQEEYLKIKKRNQLRLMIAVFISIVIIIIAYFILQPSQENKISDNRPKEAVVNIVGEKNNFSFDHMTQNSAFNEKITQNHQTTILQNSIQPAKIKNATNSNNHISNPINHLVPLIPDNKTKARLNDKNSDMDQKKLNQVTIIDKKNINSSQLFENSENKNNSPINKMDSMVSVDKKETNNDIKPNIEQGKKIVPKDNKSSELIDATKNKLLNKPVQVTTLNQTSINKNLNLQSSHIKNSSIKKEVITIQVSSLSDPIKAQALRAELVGKGFPVRVERFVNQGKNFYRVRVGVYNNQEEALKVISKLKAAGYFSEIAK